VRPLVILYFRRRGRKVPAGTPRIAGRVPGAAKPGAWPTRETKTPNLANDDNPSSYWESANNAFPQWLQVDLAAPTDVGRIVLATPSPSRSTRPAGASSG
jgi:hypothetical protein